MEKTPLFDSLPCGWRDNGTPAGFSAKACGSYFAGRRARGVP